MADSNLLLFLSFFLVFSLFINGVKPDAHNSHAIEEVRSSSSSNAIDDHSINNSEFEQLHSKILLLETHIDESNTKLKAKDQRILQLEKDIQDKSNTVATLKKEIENIQKKGSSDAKERVAKAHARASELQKQIEMLKKQSEQQKKEKIALEIKVKESEKKFEELSSRLEELQKINNEQKTKIYQTERALQVAEEEMVKVKLEINKITKELMEVHGAWLPPWLFEHLMYYSSLVKDEWDEHGKPVMEVVVQKVQEKRGHAEKWAEPHIVTINTKWVPVVKERWLVVAKYAEPHVKTVAAKTVQVSESSKLVAKSHIIKAQELADPYYQEVKKLSKPYINQVAIVAKPHVEKARTVLKPYTKKAVHVYGRFLEQATTYHSQVQVSVHEKLKTHEVTRPLASKELVWFVASALLALPVIILFRIFTAMFCKKSKSCRSYYARRKVKRGYVDK